MNDHHEAWEAEVATRDVEQEQESALCDALVAPLMGRDGDPLLATGTRSMWVSVVERARRLAFETALEHKGRVFVATCQELAACKSKLARVEAAALEAIDAWNLWTGQEMYGEHIREGMVGSDFEAWESSIDGLRAALADSGDKP